MKTIFKKNQRGMAILAVVMMLGLASSFALMAYRVSSTELEISRYSEHEVASQYLAESGIAQVISWVTRPSTSPDNVFFEAILTTDCTGTAETPDFTLTASQLKNPTDYFSELNEMGEIDEIRFYQAVHPDGICAVQVISKSDKGAQKKVRVELSKNPLGSMTAAIQGLGSGTNHSPVLVHWGEIRYTGTASLGTNLFKIPMLQNDMDPNISPYDVNPSLDTNIDRWMRLNVQSEILSPDPEVSGDTPFPSRSNILRNQSAVKLDEIDENSLKRFIKMNGEYYTISPGGHLLQGAIDKGTFEDVFDGSTSPRLAWIESVPGSPASLIIDGGQYNGYFYFNGDVTISGNQAGMDNVEVLTPPVDGIPVSMTLSNINLIGLFYVDGRVTMQDYFSAYGAFYAREGFTGPGANDLEVWYNNSYQSSVYPGVRSITPIPGTWTTLTGA